MNWKEVGFQIADGLFGGILTTRRISKKIYYEITKKFPQKYADKEMQESLKDVIADIAEYFLDPDFDLEIFADVAQDTLDILREIDILDFLK